MSDDFGIRIDDRDLLKMKKVLVKAHSLAPVKAQDASKAMANDLIEIVKANASGRPGPEIVTGHYVGSIRILRHRHTLLASTNVVGTTEPQANRLEFGFVGTDSLGRHYHQPAFPHWRPGIAILNSQKKKYADILRGALPK